MAADGSGIDENRSGNILLSVAEEGNVNHDAMNGFVLTVMHRDFLN